MFLPAVAYLLFAVERRILIVSTVSVREKAGERAERDANRARKENTLATSPLFSN